MPAHTECIGAELRQRGAKSLSHWRSAGRYRDLACRRHPDIAEFERPAPGALHAVGQADANVAAFGVRGGLTTWKVLPLRGPKNFSLAAGIIATVILHLLAGTCLQRFQIRHLFRRDEMAAAQFGAIELEPSRHPVHHA